MIRHIATLIICFAVRADVWAVVPQPSPVLRESVEAIELNSFYDGDGRLVFQQAIFFDGKGDVIAWRLVKDKAALPKRDWEGGYVATWLDADQVRQVRTGSVRETWTDYDVELEHRETLPQEKRRGLSTERASR